MCCRNQNGYEYISEDEEEEEQEEEQEERYFYVGCDEKDHLVADIIRGGDALLFSPNHHHQRNPTLPEEFMSPVDSLNEDPNEDYAAEAPSVHNYPSRISSESEDEVEIVFEEKPPRRDVNSLRNSVPNQGGPTMGKTIDVRKSDLMDNDKEGDGKHHA